jgi:hypothetical protein
MKVTIKTKEELLDSGWFINGNILDHHKSNAFFRSDMFHLFGKTINVDANFKYDLWTIDWHMVKSGDLPKVVASLEFKNIEEPIDIWSDGGISVGCNSMTPKETEELFCNLMLLKEKV